jgi:FMN phosphatase YigB (HAD superfamily)
VTKVNIAFDLDGVFLPDHKHIPKLTQKKFFKLTLYERPLFNPTYPFDIVTARVEARRKVTEKWISQLQRQPENIFMRADEKETPAEFKFRIASQQQYKIYVESDPQICQDMEQLCATHSIDLKVIHFDSWISGHWDLK